MNSLGALALVGAGEYLPVMQDLENALIQSGIKNGKANTFIQLPTAAGAETPHPGRDPRPSPVGGASSAESQRSKDPFPPGL
jgi:hypothetical protein